METMLSMKGRPLLVIDGYKFSFHKTLKNGTKRWICTKKSCKSFIKSNEFNQVVESQIEHNHDNENDDNSNRQNSANNLERKNADQLSDSQNQLQCMEFRNSDDEDVTRRKEPLLGRISSYPAVSVVEPEELATHSVHNSNLRGKLCKRALALQSPALHGSMEENFLESSPSSPPASSSRATPCRAAPHHLGYRVREKVPHPWMDVRKGVEKVARDIKYIHIQDVNALVRRLRVLNTSVEGDPTAHAREVTIIVKALREAGVIE